MVVYDKSFATHPKSEFWSKKNKDLPKDVYKSSSKKYIFDCDCGHEFVTSLNKISFNRWCYYCSKPPKTLCNNDDCKVCFNKSFASHPKSKFWSKKTH